jgi:hypothetical protein
VSAGLTGIPSLAFAVESVEAVEQAVVPTLRFLVRVDAGGADVRSLALNVQLRIDAQRRSYDERERERLAELFGDASQWSTGLRSLLWTQAALTVPGFRGETLAVLVVPLTYDFEVIAAKYLSGLGGGEAPLSFLFSGTLFYAGADGRLQAARVPWDCEAEHRLPVAVWREAVERAFPGTAWLRLGRDAFERLRAYKTAAALPTWDDAIGRLLEEAR